MANTNYDINYNDARFKDVEADKKQAISDVEKTYSGMINQSDAYYQAQINASKEWEKKQTQIQNQQTDFAIQEIEQQKAQEKKDYTKEQSGAYVDWQKQSDSYGAEAEAMAAQGMQGTGYSESSLVSMYNTYQNRVATARESYNLAIQNYNNAITEARLQNSATLAEIAYQALQKQLELSLQGFQYKNQLLMEKANKKTEVENQYYTRYQDVLAQINKENALAEQVRQYNTTLAEQQRQHNEEMSFKKAQLAEEQRQYNATLAFQKEQASKSSSGGGGIKSGSSGSSIKKPYSSSSGKSITNNKKVEKSSPVKKSSDLDKTTAKSILSLGQGPISSKNLAKQVASGKVVESKNDKGKTVFKYGRFQF
jgi:hypothetical protein